MSITPEQLRVEDLEPTEPISLEDATEYLQKQYGFLANMFPGSVLANEKVTSIDQMTNAHDFTLTVGSPSRASDLFAGKSLEIGGPTYAAKQIKVVNGVITPGLVTNIALAPGVDEIADARNLQYDSGSFSTVFSSNLPGRERKPDPSQDPTGTLRHDAIAEAYRVLEPGGHFVFVGATPVDLTDALERGFTIDAGDGCIVGWLAILQDKQTEALGNPMFQLDFVLRK